MKPHHPDAPRSPEGLRRGGATRPVGSTTWGTNGFIADAVNNPAGSSGYLNIGSHAPRPPHALQPGASEASPKGEKAAGAPTPRVAAQPAGMIGRRK
jgi:hypothetical protein